MKEHLIFFDASCNLCKRSVKLILKADANDRFLFAPLSGPTAKEILKGERAYLLDQNSMILLENYQGRKPKLWLRGRAALRTFFLLGGSWKLIGWLYIMPGANLIYRLIARHRHLLGKGEYKIPQSFEKKFLP